MARPPEHLAEQQRTLGRYLAALRDAAGLFQADIARAVPCHRTTVTHAEAGSQLPASDFWETADRLVGADGALIARYDELIHAKPLTSPNSRPHDEHEGTPPPSSSPQLPHLDPNGHSGRIRLLDYRRCPWKVKACSGEKLSNWVLR